MERIEQNNRMQRRSFFARILGGAAGIGIFGRFFRKISNSNVSFRNHASIHIKIHTQAVPRTNKEYKPVG
jgi:hypothetical protein